MDHREDPATAKQLRFILTLAGRIHLQQLSGQPADELLHGLTKFQAHELIDELHGQLRQQDDDFRPWFDR